MLTKLVRKIVSQQGRADIRYFIARKLCNPVLRPCGFTLIADHFYQPIPNRKEAALYANEKRPHGGYSIDYAIQLKLISDLLHSYSNELNNPEDFCAAGYRMEYGGFGSGDAEMLYALIRHLTPRRVIEVGAGTSSQVILAALRKNTLDGHPQCFLTSIDPYPNAAALNAIRLNSDYVQHEFITARVQNVPLSLYESLGENDILFVDSSHVFKPGSDVEHEFLRIYPAVKKGVWIHMVLPGF